MNVLFNEEKTAMVQPDSSLFENYLSSKQDTARINKLKVSQDERIEVLSDSNDRLNAENQALKQKLRQLSQDQEQPTGGKQLIAKMKLLENHYKSEKKKAVLLSIKVERLQSELARLNNLQATATLENADINSIKSINTQLSSLLEKLKK